MNTQNLYSFLTGHAQDIDNTTADVKENLHRSGNPAYIPFNVGVTYKAFSVCNSNCVWSFKVIKRTTKRATIINDEGNIRNVAIYADNVSEFCYPLGRYKMAPVLRAKELKP